MSMILTGKRILVLGAGVSGRAAARFCVARGGLVTLADDAAREKLAPEVAELEALGVAVAAGSLAGAGTAYELAILSPGIAVENPVVAALRAADCEVIGEIELAWRFTTVPVVAVTGTNGKTTVTKLIGKLLESAGKKVYVCGNVGDPMLNAIGCDYDCLVVEVSSFQLETCPTFRPKVAVWLNLTPDHLDRHGDMEGYARAKGRIFANQTSSDAAVVNREDGWGWKLAKESAATILPYTTDRKIGVGSWLEGEEIVVLMPGTDGVRLPAKPMALPGLHNVGNAMAAALAVSALGVPAKSVWGEALAFKGLGHRIEKFMEWRGVSFVDDSKATNVDAAVRAIETIDGPIVWLAGGVEKGSDYLPLRAGLEKYARLMVMVGPNTARMARELEGAAPLAMAKDWPEGVRLAVEAARPGDTVLLAPACSSFDFFKSYAERGDVFRKLAEEETGRIDGGR